MKYLSVVKNITGGDRPMSGPYPEVVIKQLRDYRSGMRAGSVMQALAKDLPDRDIADLGAYYAYLPACISCHGGVDQKLGAPWIEGMPHDYLVAQLTAFRSGNRHDDSQAQMRNMARAMTAQEIDEVSAFYARKAGSGER